MEFNKWISYLLLYVYLKKRVMGPSKRNAINVWSDEVLWKRGWIPEALACVRCVCLCESVCLCVFGAGVAVGDG